MKGRNVDDRTMSVLYVVEVEALPADGAAAIDGLADAFGVDRAKASALLARLPGVVTRPVERTEAERVADLFAKAGLPARVREERPAAPTTAPTHAVDAAPVGAASVEHDASGPDAAPRPARPNVSPPEPASAGRAFFTTAGGSAARGDATAGAARHDDATPGDKAPAPLHATHADARATEFGGTRVSARVPLRAKLLLTGIVPSVLTAGAMILALLLTVPPALQATLSSGAQAPAVSLAAGIAAGMPNGSLAAATAHANAVLEAARPGLRDGGALFAIAVAPDGSTVAGWSGDTLGADAVSAELGVLPAAGTTAATHTAIDAAGRRLTVASAPIRTGGSTAGTVYLGVPDAAIGGALRGALGVTVAAALLPLALAVIIASLLASALSRNILRLIRAADQISRGDLTQSVDVRSNDELGDLSRAIERMRVSLEEGLERLRRRRR